MPDDGARTAVAAPLLYVTGAEPGIRRVRRGRGFCYLNPDGSAVKGPAVLVRIRALAIPPAYKDVWICQEPCGHLLATGRDQKGRKQYRYHKDWHGGQDATQPRMQRISPPRSGQCCATSKHHASLPPPSQRRT
jgi:DNA topoisomerase I